MLHHPFGLSDRRIPVRPRFLYAEGVVIEIGVVVLTIACFALLELYAVGCEKV